MLCFDRHGSADDQGTPRGGAKAGASVFTPAQSTMSDHPWPWDDDEMQAAAVRARRRTRRVLAAATVVSVPSVTPVPKPANPP